MARGELHRDEGKGRNRGELVVFPGERWIPAPGRAPAVRRRRWPPGWRIAGVVWDSRKLLRLAWDSEAAAIEHDARLDAGGHAAGLGMTQAEAEGASRGLFEM